MNKTLTIISALILLGSAPAYSNEIEELTNEEYCESIYWEDADNCIYIEADHLVDKDFCNSIPFEETRKTCLEAIEEDKTIYQTKG